LRTTNLQHKSKLSSTQIQTQEIHTLLHKLKKAMYCAANKLRGTFDQCSPAVKTLYFVPIACQCVLANCAANARRPA